MPRRRPRKGWGVLGYDCKSPAAPYRLVCLTQTKGEAQEACRARSAADCGLYFLARLDAKKRADALYLQWEKGPLKNLYRLVARPAPGAPHVALPPRAPT